MSNSFQAHSYQIIPIGRYIKSSKTKHSWTFSLEGEQYSVEFFNSKVSGKRKILLNGEVQVSFKKSIPGETVPLKIGSHYLLLTKTGKGTYDLRCDNISFSACTDQMRGFRPMEGSSFSPEDSVPQDPELSTHNKVNLSSPVVTQRLQPTPEVVFGAGNLPEVSLQQLPAKSGADMV